MFVWIWVILATEYFFPNKVNQHDHIEHLFCVLFSFVFYSPLHYFWTMFFCPNSVNMEPFPLKFEIYYIHKSYLIIHTYCSSIRISWPFLAPVVRMWREVQLLVSTFVNLNFAFWRHAFAISDLLFRHLGSVACLPMAAFSSRHRGQLSFPGV